MAVKAAGEEEEETDKARRAITPHGKRTFGLRDGEVAVKEVNTEG